MTHGDNSPSATRRGGFFRTAAPAGIRHIPRFAALAALTLCFAAAVSGCGEEAQNALSYEKPIYAMKAAANYGDEESYLSCWLPQEKQHFRQIENRENGFLDSVFSRDDHESRLRAKIRACTELDENEIKELEDQAAKRYGTRLEFSKANRLSVDFRVQDSMDLLSDSREVVVVRYMDVWYIYGEVISSFTFARS